MTLHPCRTLRKREQRAFWSALKSVANCQHGFRADLEYVRLMGESVAYTPKHTIEYEKLIRARCAAATGDLCALAKSRPNQSATDKSNVTRKCLAASESTQCLDKLSSRNGSGSDPLERNLPLEISILALFPIPKYVSRKTKELMLNGRLFPTKKPDADNIIKVILDALNGLAYIYDA